MHPHTTKAEMNPSLPRPQPLNPTPPHQKKAGSFTSCIKSHQFPSKHPPLHCQPGGDLPPAAPARLDAREAHKRPAPSERAQSHYPDWTRVTPTFFSSFTTITAFTQPPSAARKKPPIALPAPRHHPAQYAPLTGFSSWRRQGR